MNKFVDWKDDYRTKLATAEQAAARIESHDRLMMSATNSVPLDIFSAIDRRALELEDVQVFTGMMCHPFEFLKPEYLGHMTCCNNFIGPLERMALKGGNLIYFSCHLSQADRCFNYVQGRKVFLAEVTPPDERGYMSLGTCGIGNGWSYQGMSTLGMVQVNRKVPWVHGEQNLVHVSEVDVIVEGDHDLPAMPVMPVSAEEKKIGELIAAHVDDGSTIQLGIGNIPNAVAHALMDKKDLGVHTELLSDSVVDLTEQGVVTGRCKNLHRGKIVVGGMIFGSQRLYDFVDHNPIIHTCPFEYVNNPTVVALNDNMISINSALNVDLTSQVASESIGASQYSGTGGQLDFVRGACMSKGGKSFIALPATMTKKDGSLASRIVTSFKPGTITTTPRADVMYVVTEFGIADVYMQNIPERVRRLIAIAHPDFREDLEREARAAGLLPQAIFTLGAA